MRMPILPILLVLAPCLVAASPASAANVSARVVAIDPQDATTVPLNEPLYLRIEYASDVPVRFQASGSSAGASVPGAMNAAPIYPAGDGEALVWISFREPARIDGVRIRVWDAQWNESEGFVHPVSLSWAGTASVRRTPAPWVQAMNGEQQQKVQAALQARTSRGGGDAIFMAIFTLAGWSIPGYWVLQIYTWRRVRGSWRKWGMLPLWITLPLLGYTMFALLAGSNLWPLMLLFVSPFAFIYLAFVLFLRWQNGEPAQSVRA